MNVKIVNKSNNELPAYAEKSSAGIDIRAHIIEGALTLDPFQQEIISTGLYLELPEGTFGMITPRSGLAAKYGISITNSPGILDSSYREELKIILINMGKTQFKIYNGDRIAQFILMSYNKIEFEIVDQLSKSDRIGGFGSTGVK